jgi:hypothetical protein
MKAIKFVQWSSSISICIVIFAGLLCLFTRVATVAEWTSFAGVAALFIAPEKVVAFFGPVLKRKQEAERPPEETDNG